MIKDKSDTTYEWFLFLSLSHC